MSGTQVSGTLYIIATPIGNLEDITIRAVRILGEVDLIACEDTRETRKLLDRYNIARPLVSYHEHNERTRSADLLRDLEAGKNIALVSDAGTPLIADPGYRLVEQARQIGILVSPIPGPSALLAALSASGLPTDSFIFHGFLPSKKGQRRRLLEDLRPSQTTLVFYETPHRVLGALEDIEETMGPRPVVLARELTKIHEEFLRGTAAEIREALAIRPSVKGEITLMIGKSETVEVEDTPLAEAVEKLVESGVPRMEALKTVARQRGLSKREVYKQVNEY
ncbi:MAG TPA: 16S rRNA (cytidine(1402)-2'-O)-methyltransferase [Bryobacteraceae bacterium]|nr:16S rRNA (cytidine(1402)-2'-O)-methyltransferase [Bryobacteraceae bacterium]